VRVAVTVTGCLAKVVVPSTGVVLGGEVWTKCRRDGWKGLSVENRLMSGTFALWFAFRALSLVTRVGVVTAERVNTRAFHCKAVLTVHFRCSFLTHAGESPLLCDRPLT